MSGMRMQIKGLDKLEAISKHIGAVNTGKIVNQALKQAAYIIEGESKKVTPVDTGFLRSSITTAFGSKEAILAPRASYGVFVHEGTKFVRGRPFFEWGAEKGKPEVENAIKIMLEDIGRLMR